MFIQGKLISEGDSLSEVILIRRKVFIEELGIPEEIEFDEGDKKAIHAIAYENGLKIRNCENDTFSKAVATGRVTFDGEVCQIGHVAVLKEDRGKKYGDFIVKMLLKKAFSAGIKEVSINTQANTVEFFRKIGFHRINESDMDIGIEECKMMISDYDIVRKCNK